VDDRSGPLLRSRSEGFFVRRPRRPISPLLLALALLLAACAGTPSPTIPPDATGSTAPATTATPVVSPGASPTPAATTAYPATLTDDEGSAVKIPTEPQRIVSLSPAVTETLFAIGAGGQLVGKSVDPADFPPAAHDLPVVAQPGSVDVEKIVALQADLVIAGGNGFNPPESVAKLRSLGIPVLVIYAPDIEGVFKDIELVGTAVGAPGVAKDLTAAMRAGFDQVGAATRGLTKPRTFYEIDASNAIFGPAKDSFIEAMITLAGGDPITTGSTTAYEISLEKLVTADPEVIVLGDYNYGTTAEIVSKRPGWTGMTAVKTHAIRPIDDIVTTRPGPRLVDGLRALAMAIHPDLVLPSPVPLPSEALPAVPGSSVSPVASASPSESASSSP
jgi:iron complex transport system substrate-binding protein